LAGGNVLDDFNWIEDYFSPFPAEKMRAAGHELEHLYPTPRIDFVGFGAGLEWQHYQQQRRACLPEIVEPLISVDCSSREESERYDALRAAWLKEMKPELQHRFLVAFFIAANFVASDSSLFEALKKLLADGTFRFANVWKIVDPMTIPGFAEDLIRRKNEEKLGAAKAS
jgi:hypothetical protein